jgi:hypothetical protein
MTTARNTSAVAHVLTVRHVNGGVLQNPISVIFSAFKRFLKYFKRFPGDMRFQQCINRTAVILTNFR